MFIVLLSTEDSNAVKMKKGNQSYAKIVFPSKNKIEYHRKIENMSQKNMEADVQMQKVYSTRYSQAVSHPSTDRARRCLTSVFGREPVHSTRCGRRH